MNKTFLALALLTTQLASAQNFVEGKLISRHHHREIRAVCAGVDANQKCRAYNFYFVNHDVGAESVKLITEVAFSLDDIASLKEPGGIAFNVFTESKTSATKSVVNFVHDADGSYGDSRAADIAKGATRGVGYAVGTPIGIAGDVVGYTLGVPYHAIKVTLRNPKLNKLIHAISSGETVKINVGKLDLLERIIFCAGEHVLLTTGQQNETHAYCN